MFLVMSSSSGLIDNCTALQLLHMTLSKCSYSCFAPAVDSLADIPEETIPHLGAEEVIDEVVTLLGRLETDRGDTDESFKKEQVRVGWLQGKIDRISQKRLYELPKVVQQGEIISELENFSFSIRFLVIDPTILFKQDYWYFHFDEIVKMY